MLSGELSSLSMPGLIQLLDRIGATGRLTITSEEQACIVFHKGQVLGATSSWTARLGEVMVERSFIDADTLAMVLRHQRETGLPLGRLLVDLNLVPVEIVTSEIDVQIHDVLSRLVNENEGVYQFETTEEDLECFVFPTCSSTAKLLFKTFGIRQPS